MQNALQQTPDDRAMGFERVEGGTETSSAGALLVAAYLLMWVLLFGIVWLSWKRLIGIEARLHGLERGLGIGDASRKAADRDR